MGEIVERRDRKIVKRHSVTRPTARRGCKERDKGLREKS